MPRAPLLWTALLGQQPGHHWLHPRGHPTTGPWVVQLRDKGREKKSSSDSWTCPTAGIGGKVSRVLLVTEI